MVPSDWFSSTSVHSSSDRSFLQMEKNQRVKLGGKDHLGKSNHFGDRTNCQSGSTCSRSQEIKTGDRNGKAVQNL